jgi:uncharacterized membrane protein (UPF0127 family)
MQKSLSIKYIVSSIKKVCRQLGLYSVGFVVVLPLLASGCGLPSVKSVPVNVEIPHSIYNTPLYIGEKAILVEIADTSEKRSHGLSGRRPLTENQGMLFDFRGTRENRPSFWMKDMLFNLDLIWIKNGTVVYITKNVPRPTDYTENLPLYSPPEDIDMVLEVISGFSERNQIQVGTKIVSTHLFPIQR